MSTKARHPLTKAIKKLMGWQKYKKDILRHTAASMMIAKHKNVAEVSLQLGNSPDIVFRHYRELVTKEAAESFWKRVCDAKVT